jgi:hypothetical protein
VKVSPATFFTSESKSNNKDKFSGGQNQSFYFKSVDFLGKSKVFVGI